MSVKINKLKIFCKANDSQNVKKILRLHVFENDILLDEFYLACQNDYHEIVELLILEFVKRDYNFDMVNAFNFAILHASHKCIDIIVKNYDNQLKKFINSNLNDLYNKIGFDKILTIIEYTPEIPNYDIFTNDLVNYLVYDDKFEQCQNVCEYLEKLNQTIPGFDKIIKNSNVFNHVDFICRNYLIYDRYGKYLMYDRYEKLKNYREILYYLLANYHSNFLEKNKYPIYILLFCEPGHYRFMDILYPTCKEILCDNTTFYDANKKIFDKKFINLCDNYCPTQEDFESVKMLKNLFPEIDPEMRDRICYRESGGLILDWLNNDCHEPLRTKSARNVYHS